MKHFAITLSIVILSAAALQPADAQYRREEHHRFDLAPGGRLSVDTFKGSVSVRTWDKPAAEIQVVVLSDGDYEDAQEDVELTEIEILAYDDRIHIETDYDALSSFWDIFSWFGGESNVQPFVHYTITMPATAALHIDDFKSEIDVRDLRSNVFIETFKGSITANTMSGRLKVETYKGTIDVAGLAGGLLLDTYKGSGTVEFASFLQPSRVETYKGDIALYLPGETGFDLDADVGRRGSLESDIRFSSIREGEIRGKVNGGGPLLLLETSRGTFEIRKR